MKKDLHQTRPTVLTRNPSRRRKLRRILIVCEGEKTEPNYFKSFPENPEVYDALDVTGLGNNTVAVVKKAIELRDAAEKKQEPYIETWAVFDRDDFPLSNFLQAMQLAQRNHIHCAYSIESFELWYLLHFNYIDSAISRNEYVKKLSERLGKEYRKNDTGMYDVLHDRMHFAIQNASRLYNKQQDKPLAEQNPVTLVFQLVQRLATE